MAKKKSAKKKATPKYPRSGHGIPHVADSAYLDFASSETRGVANEILIERTKQIKVQGYDTNHDDAHVSGELAEAAACYAAAAAHNGHIYTQDRPGNGTLVFSELWPFELEYDKRDVHDPRKLLVKAAAFLVAEIERLDRAEKQRDIRRRAGKAGPSMPKPPQTEPLDDMSDPRLAKYLGPSFTG